MRTDPRDIPETPEGREALAVLIDELRASGDLRELGIALTRMAHLVKQVGAGEGQDAWAACVSYGSEAESVLRQTDDRAALAAALTGAHLNFLPKQQREEKAREALAIARELGDPEQEGWAIFSLAMIGYPGESPWPDLRMEDAMACFERAGSLSGKATCLHILGASSSDGRWRMNLEAAELYEKDGRFERAARAYSLAVFWGREEVPAEEAERYLMEGIRCAKLGGHLKFQATIYGALQSLWHQAKNADKSAHYAALEDSLDIALYGSRANRLRHEIEIDTDLLEMLSGGARKKVQRRIRANTEAIRALEGRHNLGSPAN